MFMRMLYDEGLAQAAYVIGCQRTGEAIVIDPMRDVDQYVDLVASEGLRITAVAETHIHADYLSGAREMADRTGARVYVSGEGGVDWSSRWLDGYDHVVLHDGDHITIGGIDIEALHTPGHTPEHIAYLVTDRGSGATEPIGIASGDFLFVGDLGRPDLLETAAGETGAKEPAARRLRESVERLKSLPEFVQVWPGHGSGSACGKALGAVPTSTVGYELRFNPAVRISSDEDEFLAYILAGQPEPPLYFARMKRQNRDGPPVLGGLPAPKRLEPSDLDSIDTSTTALVDTRKWDAFRAGHVGGALFLPRIRSFATNAGSVIGEDEPIVLIVESDELDGAIRELVHVGLDRIEGWLTPADLVAWGVAGGVLVMTPQVEPADVAKFLAGPNRAVLDVRSAREFDEGHMDDATNITHTRLVGRLDEVPAEDLLVHCRLGVRSAVACSVLERAGYPATNLRGGYEAWKTEAQSQPA